MKKKLIRILLILGLSFGALSAIGCNGFSYESGNSPVWEVPDNPEQGDDSNETPDIPEQGGDSSETPDNPEQGGDSVETPDNPEQGGDSVETPDNPEQGGDSDETPDAPEQGGDSDETPDAPEQGGDSNEMPDAPDQDGDSDETPDNSEQGGNSDETPDTPEQGGDSDETPDAPEQGGDSDETPDNPEQGGDIVETPDEKFTVNFDGLNITLEVTKNGVYGELPTTDKTGYTFDGWFTTKDGGEKITAETVVTLTGNQTVYAHWTANTYTVTFDAVEGECATGSKVVTYNSVYGELPVATKTGHTFNGWFTAEVGGDKVDEADIVTIITNTTLYAQYTEIVVEPTVCVVTFDTQGGECATATVNVEEGEEIGTLPIAVKEGFTFEGWFTQATGGIKIEATTVVNINVTWYAQYTEIVVEPTVYVVTFDAQGGECDTTTKNIIKGGLIGELPVPTKAGYNFKGWFTEAIGGSNVTIITSIKSTITFYAQWTANTYVVYFNAQGGECATMQKEVTYGTTYEELPDATRNSYTFEGWFTLAEGGDKITADTEVTIITAQTLYAQWTKIVIEPTLCVVTFNTQGGECATTTVNVEEGKTIGALPVATKCGYTFNGWYTQAIGGDRIDETKVVNAAMTLYAQYTEIVVEPTVYVVTFDTQGGECATATVNVEEGEEIDELPEATKNGYTFSGWYTQAIGGDKVVSTTVVTATMTLYAQWTAMQSTLTFNTNGGDIVSPGAKLVTYGKTYGKMPTPTRTGYTFNGWYTQATGGDKVKSTDTVAIVDETTLYAQWTVNTYVVYFNANNGEGITTQKDVTYGGAYGELPEATRTGYTFDGWYTLAEDGDKITEDTEVRITTAQTLYAHWTEIVVEPTVYVVMFDTQGGECATTTVYIEEGEEIGALPIVTKNGYTFNGWFTEASGGDKIETTAVVNTNMTLYAQWTANECVVYFDTQEGECEMSQRDVTYGGTYGELPTPTRSGYEFAGWYTLAEGGDKVTADTIVTSTTPHTLYAHWTEKVQAVKCRVYFDPNNGECGTVSQEVVYGETYGELPTPIRTGYEFAGWYTLAEGGELIEDTTIVTTAKAHFLYARWV